MLEGVRNGAQEYLRISNSTESKQNYCYILLQINHPSNMLNAQPEQHGEVIGG